MADVPKIYKAIAAIQAGVGNVPKAGVGPASQGSYKYVKNDDILEAISKLMIEHKVITKPVITNHQLVTREIGSNRTVPMTAVASRMRRSSPSVLLLRVPTMATRVGARR